MCFREKNSVRYGFERDRVWLIALRPRRPDGTRLMGTLLAEAEPSCSQLMAAPHLS